MQHYETLGAIGQGQYGTAYKARHRLDGQLYCIKRIPMSAKVLEYWYMLKQHAMCVRMGLTNPSVRRTTNQVP